MQRSKALAVALCLLAAPAAAFHKQTPPIVGITGAGDNGVPRLSSTGRRFVLALDVGGNQIFRRNWKENTLDQITAAGDNANPTVSRNGYTIAWDADCTLLGCPEPGRQIFMSIKEQIFQATHDPTGTSVNPSLSGKGTRLAFESTGNFVGQNPGAKRQIFVRASDGTIAQASHGNGVSRNPSFDTRGTSLVFESTNDLAGNDTGITQIWLLPPSGFAEIVTSGAGPSRRPALAGHGRVATFESTANLTGDGSDTGVSQIFLYDVVQRSVTQITDDPAGCSDPSISGLPSDLNVAYVCHGEGFLYRVRLAQQFRLPITGGDTSHAVAEVGRHFVTVATTADLLHGGTTPGHRIYLLNIFKLALTPVD